MSILASEREGHGLCAEGPQLDMQDCRDRGLLFESIRRGWQVTPTRKREYFAALDEIIRDPESDATARAQAVRCLMAEQDQMLRHAHLLDKNYRLDAGLATERVGVGDVVLRRPITVQQSDAGAPELPGGNDTPQPVPVDPGASGVDSK